MQAENSNRLNELGITAITFDLDDTLWPCAPVIAGAEKVYFEWIEKHFPKVTEKYDLDGMTSMRKELLNVRPELKNDVTELRRLTTAELLKPHGATDADIAECMRVCLEARQLVSLYSDVQSALEQLSFHYRLGSLTNGNANLQSIGIGHIFDVELAATMSMPAKPAADMFHTAFERLGVQAERVLHVGDHPENDVAAARNIGCKTAWINRDGLTYPEGASPADINIVDLNELVAMAPSIPSK